MIAILSALLGFFSSFVPEIFYFLKDKKDKEHELKLIDRQVEALKNGHSSRLEEIQIKADSEESKYLYQHAGMQIAGIASNDNNHWINILSASVRPTITYTFFLLYALVKITSFIKYGLVSNVWNGEDQGIFCAVIGFWFGHRAFGKVRLNGYGYANGNGDNGAGISSSGNNITNAIVNGSKRGSTSTTLNSSSSSNSNSRIHSDINSYNYGNGRGYGIDYTIKTNSKDKEYVNVRDKGKISGKDKGKISSKDRGNVGIKGHIHGYR
jgi:hypothetical protein